MEEIKTFRCFLCENEITETRKVHGTDAIPDQNNCDLNVYEHLGVEGGKLLKVRPTEKWVAVLFKTLSEGRKPDEEGLLPAPGGICNECLESNETVKALEENISFENP